MKTCRLCLQMNVKVSYIGDTEALKLLQAILIKRGFDVLSTHYICVFCKHLLNKFYLFIQKIIEAQTSLKELIKQKKKVLVNDLENINGSSFSHNLSYKKIEHYFVGNKTNKVSAVNYKKTIEDNYSLGNDSLLVPRQNSVDCHSAASDISSINEDHKPQHFLADENVILPNRLRNKRKIQVFDELEENYSENDQKKEKEFKKKGENSDDDFNPENNAFSDYSSDSSEDVQYHDNGRRMKQKSPERIYPRTCEECDYEIHGKGHHRHHYLLFHKDKEYPYKKRAEHLCKFCGKRTTTIAHLRNHELTHGKPTFKCKECGKMFSSKYRLKRHQSYHEPPKYECDYCNKKMHCKSDLMRHIRTHTGEKPFKCHICGEAFAHKGNVKIHMRNRHEQEPKKKGRKHKKTSGTKKKIKKMKKV